MARATVIKLLVKARVESIEILCVELVGDEAQGFAEPLKVNYLALSEKLDDVAYIGVVDEAENVVIGQAGFLLWHDFIRRT